jgi:hypothetical protein
MTPTQIRVTILAPVCLLLVSLSAAAQKESSFSSDVRVTAMATGSRQTSLPMQSPLLGFTYDANRNEVRAISGVPGASTLSEPLSLPDEVTDVHFAPGQKYAIVKRADAALGLIAFPAATPAALAEIPGLNSSADIISFSPSGKAAAIYSIVERRLQIITGLPDAPHLIRDLSLNSMSEEPFTFAIADSGRSLVAASTSYALYRIIDGSTPEYLDRAENLAGMVFAPGSDDLVVLDRSRGTALLFQDVGRRGARRLLSDGLPISYEQVFLQVDGALVVFANKDSSIVWTIDLKTSQVQSRELPTPIATLHALRAPKRFLLSQSSGEPAWILDNSIGGVYFVPANTVTAPLAKPPAPKLPAKVFAH